MQIVFTMKCSRRNDVILSLFYVCHNELLQLLKDVHLYATHISEVLQKSQVAIISTST